MIVKAGSVTCSPLRVRTSFDFDTKDYTIEIMFANANDMTTMATSPQFDGVVTIYSTYEDLNANRPLRVYKNCTFSNMTEEITQATQDFTLTVRSR